MSDELRQASDADIDAAVKYSEPMALRGLCYLLTGDRSVAEMQTEVMRVRGLESRILGAADAETVRQKIAAFLKQHRDAGAPELKPNQDRLKQALELAVGEEIPFSEYDMWFEQTGLSPWARTFDWSEIDYRPSDKELKDFKVCVIGAGLGGLMAAVSLKRAGIPYFVIEKNSDVGGTWYEKRYPGARVDSASRSYCFAAGADFNFPYAFCPRDENLRYIQWFTERNGLRDNAIFNSEATSLNFDKTRNLWDIVVEGPDGKKTLQANAVICSVGLLNRPQMPSIKGMDKFKGASFHTARWPKDLDYEGKRVAVIGTGASGYQMAPELAHKTGELYIFQRTPGWCFDVPGYLSPLPEQAYWLDRNLPFYTNFMRLRICSTSSPQRVYSGAQVDPYFKDEHTRSPRNKLIRDDRLAFIANQLKDKPELVEKMIPPYPPMASRPILIDPAYNIYSILNEGKATLVSDGIEEINETGLRTKDGRQIDVDIIVYATGYKVNEFLFPMEVRGRSGKSAKDLWKKDGARAYLGAMLPDCPNFFMLYGPNTNSWSGLQIVDLLELTVRFATSCIASLIKQGDKTVEPTLAAYERYNDELDVCEAKMLYVDPRVNSYYRTEHGRSAANNPIDIRRLWWWMRAPAKGAPTQNLPFETRADIRPYFGEDLKVG